MKITEYKEREDGGADVKLDLTEEEAATLIEVGFLKLLNDYIEENKENK